MSNILADWRMLQAAVERSEICTCQPPHETPCPACRCMARINKVIEHKPSTMQDLIALIEQLQAKNDKLRELVCDAYMEGVADAIRMDCGSWEGAWGTSKSKKALKEGEI